MKRITTLLAAVTAVGIASTLSAEASWWKAEPYWKIALPSQPGQTPGIKRHDIPDPATGAITRSYFDQTDNHLRGKRVYYPSGNEKKVGPKNWQVTYDDNAEMHGEAKSWHPNGKVKTLTFYKHGKLHGFRAYWNEDASLDRQEYFLEGQQVSEDQYMSAANQPGSPVPPPGERGPKPPGGGGDATAEPARIGRNHENSWYYAEHDPATKRLVCSSENTGCVWRTRVAEGIDSRDSFDFCATPAGPVFVYNQRDGVYFALLHFRDGADHVPNSGESLRGRIGAGQLVPGSVVFLPGQYGAQVKLSAVDRGTTYVYHWDINQWGTHKQLADPAQLADKPDDGGESVGSGRHDFAGLNLSLEVPQGFSAKWISTARVLEMTRPDDPVLMFAHSLPGEHSRDKLLRTAVESISLRRSIGNVKEANKTDVEGPGNYPGTGAIYEATGGGGQWGIMAMAFTSENHTYVLAYAAPADSFGEYAVPFSNLMGSVKFLVAG